MKGSKFARWAVGIGVIALLLVAIFSVVLLRGGGDDGTLEQVQATGELRVGLDASFPPFESLDEAGNVIGFDADLARAVADRLGVRPVFVNIGFDGLYDALLARRVDVIISGLPYDPRWTQDVVYSQPYFDAGQLLVIRAQDSTINQASSGTAVPQASSGTAVPQASSGIPMPQGSSGTAVPQASSGTSVPRGSSGTSVPQGSSGIPMPELLVGHMIAVEWGSLGDMEARRLTQAAEGIQTLPQPTAQDALEALLAGQADAAIADAVSVYQFMGEHEGAVLILDRLSDEPYVIASRIKSRRLAEAIDQALEELRQSGILDELRARWF